MSAAMNEQLIRDVIEEVLGRINPGPAKPGAHDCQCPKPARAVAAAGARGEFGGFKDAAQACEAAAAAFVKLQQGGIAARHKAVSIIKTMAEANAAEWGRMELEE